MKPLVAPPDGERLALDYLKAALTGRGETATVGIGVPGGWTTESGDHVQIGLDGTPVVEYPVLWRTTLRVTAWSPSTTEAKRLASLCEALLLSHPGSPGWSGCLPGTGVLPTDDPDTGAALASITVRQKLRGQTV